MISFRNCIALLISLLFSTTLAAQTITPQMMSKLNQSAAAQKAASSFLSNQPISESTLNELKNDPTTKEAFSNIEDEDENAASEQKETKLAPTRLRAQTNGNASKEAFFGYTFFQQSIGSPFNLTNIPVNEDYIVGPGDEFLLQIWGKIEESIPLSVDNNGMVFIPKIGTISVAGAKFGALDTLFKNALGKLYVNFDVSVTMTRLRTIKIFVLGDVEKPGSYDVSSLSTAYVALLASGGPKPGLGSLRQILIKRGSEKTYIDLYQYLLKGDNAQDKKLQNFDTIFVNPIGQTISIEGLVKRPGKFELNGKTNIYDAIQLFAAGFKANTYGQRIQLIRIQDNEKKILLDISQKNTDALNNQLKNTYLEDGDIIKVLPILELLHNMVEIKGNVFREGIYGFTPGMTLGQLIQKAEGIKEGAILNRVEVYRFQTDDLRTLIQIDYTKKESQNFKLADRDVVRIFYEKEVFGSLEIEITGDVLNPGTFPFYTNMRVADALFWAGLPTNWEWSSVEVFRNDTVNLKNHIIELSSESIFTKPQTGNILIEPGDRLFFRINSEKQKKRFATISGEVIFPGVYPINPGETLRGLITRSNGLSPTAFTKGTIFRRQNAKTQKQAGQLLALEKEKKRLFIEKAEMNTENPTIDASYNLVYNQMIDILENKIKENEGRVVINLDDILSGKARDIELQPGDELIIPITPTSIHVVGEVENPGSFLFNPQFSAMDYIQKSGGFTKNSQKKRILVFKTNGEVSHDLGKIEIGDTIYIPLELHPKIHWMKEIREITQTVLSLLTTYAVVQNLTK